MHTQHSPSDGEQHAGLGQSSLTTGFVSSNPGLEFSAELPAQPNKRLRSIGQASSGLLGTHALGIISPFHFLLLLPAPTTTTRTNQKP